MPARTIACAFLMLAALAAGCSNGEKNRIESSGTIEGTDINVGSEVSGRVKAVRVEEGTRVNKGDTLVLIDDTDYQIQMRQALANQAAAEAQYRLAVEGSRKEDVLRAQAAFKNAEKNFARMKDLLSSQTVTQKQYDDAEERYVAAEQTYRQLRKGLRLEEIAAVRARRDQAAAQTDALRKRVRDCTILAPSGGTITLRAVEPGELVSPGANLVSITYLEKVKLMIYVNEDEISRIKLGQDAAVTIDSGEKFTGKVIYRSPVAEFTPKNVQTKEERTKLVFGVKLLVENPDLKLSPGIPADAIIDIGPARSN
jgi:HlyD family secretion protein